MCWIRRKQVRVRGGLDFARPRGHGSGFVPPFDPWDLGRRDGNQSGRSRATRTASRATVADGSVLRGGRPAYEGAGLSASDEEGGEKRYPAKRGWNYWLMKNKPTRQDAKRRARNKGTFPGIRIGERDRNILQLVFEHRFLDTELLWYLTRQEPGRRTEYRVGADGKRRPSSYGFGMKALYKRLQQLSDARLLNRHYATDRPMGRGHGGPRAVYGLGPASSQLVAKANGVSIKEIKDIVSANRVKSPFLRHALEVARIRVLLELVCARSEGQIRIMFWEQGNVLQDWVTGEDESGYEVRYSVCPDAFFGLEVVGKGRAHYFLELDRGTMPVVATGNRSDIRKKVFGYAAYRKARRHSKRYRYRQLPDGTVVGLDVRQQEDRLWESDNKGIEPIKSFRVLFVAPGATGGQLTTRGRAANILAAFPSFGKQFATSTLFWFTSLDSFDLERPRSVFGNVWLTPNPEHGLKSLIE